MNKLIDKLCIIQMILMGISTVINILFLKSILSDSYIEIGFILVILCGLVMNFLLLKKKEKKLEKLVQLKARRNILSIIIGSIIILSWMTTYVIATFNR